MLRNLTFLKKGSSASCGALSSAKSLTLDCAFAICSWCEVEARLSERFEVIVILLCLIIFVECLDKASGSSINLNSGALTNKCSINLHTGSETCGELLLFRYCRSFLCRFSPCLSINSYSFRLSEPSLSWRKVSRKVKTQWETAYAWLDIMNICMDKSSMSFKYICL